MSPRPAVIRPATIDGLGASTLQLPPGPWTTLLDGLCARFPAIDRATWRERMARGRVLDAQGRALGADTPYRVGLEVHYYREVADEARIPFEATVLHADADLVVADKPHFLPVVPAGSYVRETLLARLQQQLDNPDLVPLHRIDRDTAGLVLCSADPRTRTAYQALFRERRIDKRYEALAPALPQLAFPLVKRSRLVPGEPFFRMQEVAGIGNSETRIEVLERGPIHWRYALTPVSGRKHQLRVHMAALGAPIVNDACYPVLIARAAGDYSRPLQLLAKQLRFIDPITGIERAYASGFALLDASLDA